MPKRTDGKRLTYREHAVLKNVEHCETNSAPPKFMGVFARRSGEGKWRFHVPGVGECNVATQNLCRRGLVEIEYEDGVTAWVTLTPAGRTALKAGASE